MDTLESTHLNRKNIFMYGNTEEGSEDSFIKFPCILSQSCDFFSFDDCNFGVQKSKASTARIALWKILNIPTVYTIEASFYGANIGSLNGQHFGIKDFQTMGSKLCECFIPFFNITAEPNANIFIMDIPKEYIDLMQYYKDTHPPIENDKESSADEIGSDSNPSEFSFDKDNKLCAQEIYKTAKLLEKKEAKDHFIPRGKVKDAALAKCTVIQQKIPIPNKSNNKVKIPKIKSTNN
jgi:hypothetical protein